MEYYIEISSSAKKEMNSLPKDIAKRISRKIDSLKATPYIGKPVGRSQSLGTMIYELRFFSPNIRVYYTVKEGIVIIESVTYCGSVQIRGIGDKRSQRRDIDGLA